MIGGCNETGPDSFACGSHAGLVAGSGSSGFSTSGVCTGLRYPRPSEGESRVAGSFSVAEGTP